jgi:hypothetical protein
VAAEEGWQDPKERALALCVRSWAVSCGAVQGATDAFAEERLDGASRTRRKEMLSKRLRGTGVPTFKIRLWRQRSFASWRGKGQREGMQGDSGAPRLCKFHLTSLIGLQAGGQGVEK